MGALSPEFAPLDVLPELSDDCPPPCEVVELSEFPVLELPGSVLLELLEFVLELPGSAPELPLFSKSTAEI